MKTKAAVSTKKQSVAVKDLKAMKNPKGGAIVTTRSNIKRPGLAGPAAGGGYSK